MALVDFSSAVITPAPTDTVIPATYRWVNLQATNLLDSSGNTIGTVSCSGTDVSSKERKFSYTGSFSASGTEFYIAGRDRAGAWKISNVSFQNGDICIFDITAKIICN